MMNGKRNFTLTFLIIGICFLWTGAGYLTWLYRLIGFYPDKNVDLLTEVFGYVFQVAGLVIFSMLAKKNDIMSTSKKCFTVAIIVDYIFILASALSLNGIMALIFGYAMNLFHGIIAGFYLTMLVTKLPQQKRGMCLGLGYGLGSICSYLLSLIGEGNFLKSNKVLICYAVFAVISIILVLRVSESDFSNENNNSGLIDKYTGRLLLLAGITVLLLSAVKNVGFYFPLSDLASGKISLEFTRTFYALGLIIAGFINDKNRKYGAICCMSALVFPFVMLILKGNPDMGEAVWIMGYFFFGFFVVYRMILFADLSEKMPSALYLSGFGLMWGRLGDVVGALIGILLSENIIALVALSSVTFTITVFVFFVFYHKMYFSPVSAEENYKMLVADFAKKYTLSAREQDVFRLIIDGRSNLEIASDLFISENTVKFHIKNILKKTECANRTELIALFKK